MTSAQRGLLAADEADQWLGTPGHWQASVKGPQGGCDCKGLVRGVAAELGWPEAANLYACMMTYRRDRPVPAQLLKQGLDDTFDRVAIDKLDPMAGRQPGDVLLGKIKGHPSHLGIVNRTGQVVHADPVSKGKVRRTRLDAWLIFYPLDSAWRWKELRA